MKWFIFALVTFASGEQDIKYHEHLSFDSYVECVSFYQKNSHGLLSGLKRDYPNIKDAKIRCLDLKTILAIERGEKKNLWKFKQEKEL